MKKIISKLSLITIFALSSTIYADSVIVHDTNTWHSVPVVIDSTHKTYVIEGTVPTEGDYYYSYKGYRCFQEKRGGVGADAIVYNPGTGATGDIYCYAE